MYAKTNFPPFAPYHASASVAQSLGAQTTVFLQTNVIVVPQEVQNAFGNQQSTGDLNPYTVYAPSLFSRLSNDVIVITAIAFRADESYSNVLSQSWGNLDIQMDTIPGTMGEFVAHFPMDASVDPVTVFSNNNYTRPGRIGATKTSKFGLLSSDRTRTTDGLAPSLS